MIMVETNSPMWCLQAQQGTGEPKGMQVFRAGGGGRLAARASRGACPKRRAVGFSRLCVGPSDLLVSFCVEEQFSFAAGEIK